MYNSYHPKSPVERLALETAQNIHNGQRLNPFSSEPFIARPKRVALALSTIGERTSTVAAGLLHAVPKRSPIDGVRVIRSFGHDITNLIKTISVEPSITDPSERHEIFLAKIFNTQNIGALSLAAAVETAKLQEVLDAHDTVGDNIWNTNGYNPDDTRWQAKTTHEVLTERIPSHPLVIRFGKQIIDLEKLV